MPMTTVMARWGRRVALLGGLVGVYIVSAGLACVTGGPHTETFSNCRWIVNVPAQEIGLRPFPREPEVCPVRVSQSQPLSKFYVTDVWDYEHRLTLNHPMDVRFVDARGFAGGTYFSRFRDVDIGQPSGMLAARMEGFYSAGFQGLTGTNKTDTAINYTLWNNQTAEVRVLLSYEAEAPPLVSGPTSVQYGDPVLFEMDARQLRRAVSVEWRLNGQTQATGTVQPTGLTTLYWPVWSGVGMQTITMISQSALGRVDTITRMIDVTMPPECEGGGGPELRAAPQPGADSVVAVPFRPRNTNCPPQ